MLASIAALLRRCFARNSDARRAEAEAALAILEARKAASRLRDAIDILPEGIVFLDAEGRYILWNQQYANIYKRSADLFQPGARLADTLRVGVERGDYPEALGREEEWMKERLRQAVQSGRPPRADADRRPHHPDRGAPHQRRRHHRASRRHHRDEAARGVVPPAVRRQPGADVRLWPRRSAHPVGQRRRGEALRLRPRAGAAHEPARHPPSGRKLRARRISAASRPRITPAAPGSTARPTAHRSTSRSSCSHLTYEGQRATLIAAVDITERKARRSARRLHGASRRADRAAEPHPAAAAHGGDDRATCGATARGFAVLCVDLDNFKSVNDTLGHPFGDLLLQSVAARLRAELREQDTIARLGGDEFAILQADVEQARRRSAICWRGCSPSSASRYDLDGHHVTVGASIGVALAPGDGDDPDRLLKNADMALYRAKAEGKGSVPLLRAGDGCARAGAAAAGDGSARGAQGRGVRGALSAAGRSRHRRGPLARSADPLAASRARHDSAVRVHSGRRGNRPDRAARRCSCCAAPAPTPRNGRTDVKVAVNLSPLQFKSGNLLQAVRDALERRRPAADAAGAGDHRDAAARQERAGDSRRCMRCARSACASRWTISAPAIRR